MQPSANTFRFADFVRVLRQYRGRFIVSAVSVAVLVGLYALVRPSTWEAVQTLIVRNEAAARSLQERPGRFDRPEQLQTLQETVLELARSRSVLESTLRDVAGPSGQSQEAPSDKDIERLRNAVRMTPPKGAEFGKTEIFYLNVRDSNRERAILLTSTLCRNLQARFQQIRDKKAKSMIEELGRTVTLASAEVQTVTDRLSKVEAGVGIDLAELRILEKSPSGNSDLRSQLISLETELRDAKAALRSNQAVRELLIASTKDTGQLLAAPNRLLESQPALKRLKEGLIDAQLHAAQLRGYMTADHPRVQAAVAAELDINRSLSQELAMAIRGVEDDLKLTNARVNVLSSQLNGVHKRLDRLATVRAEYGNLTDELQHRQQILSAAEENLADARASEAAARSSSLISPVDSPDTGSSPVGPGRMLTILCGIVGGVAVGLGVVFLTAGPGLLGQSAADADSLAILKRPAPRPMSGLSLKEALSKINRRRPSWN